jgi:hypothetical protein
MSASPVCSSYRRRRCARVSETTTSSVGRTTPSRWPPRRSPSLTPRSCFRPERSWSGSRMPRRPGRGRRRMCADLRQLEAACCASAPPEGDLHVPQCTSHDVPLSCTVSSVSLFPGSASGGAHWSRVRVVPSRAGCAAARIVRHRAAEIQRVIRADHQRDVELARAPAAWTRTGAGGERWDSRCRTN